MRCRWNDFESNISTSFVDLRHKQEFFDVTLSCDHGNRQVQAHKVILAACSPFFRKVLARNPHQNPLIYLKGIDYDNLSAILNFMYHGEVNVAQEDLSGFLKVAEELAVKGLTDGNKNNGQESPEKQPQQTSATKKVVKKNPLKRPPMLQPAPNALGKSSPSSLLVPGTHQNSSSSAASNKTSSSSNNSPMVSKKPKMSSASSANYDDMQPHVVKPDLENSQDDDGSEEMEDSFGGGRFAQDGGFGGGDGGEFLDESMADEMGGMTHGALDADGNKGKDREIDFRIVIIIFLFLFFLWRAPH